MKFIYIALVFTLLACNKSEPLPVPDSCSLCSLVPAWEGTYRGYVSGVTFQDDSVAVQLSQIYLGNSQYEDSMFISLLCTSVYDMAPNDIIYDTIRIGGVDGKNMRHDPHSYTYNNVKYVNNDTLRIVHIHPVYEVCSQCGFLVRQ